MKTAFNPAFFVPVLLLVLGSKIGGQLIAHPQGDGTAIFTCRQQREGEWKFCEFSLSLKNKSSPRICELSKPPYPVRSQCTLPFVEPLGADHEGACALRVRVDERAGQHLGPWACNTRGKKKGGRSMGAILGQGDFVKVGAESFKVVVDETASKSSSLVPMKDAR